MTQGKTFEDFKAKVFVKGPNYFAMTMNTFLQEGEEKYSRVDSVDEADIVVLTGGEDINPVIYGEKPMKGTYFRTERDKADVECVEEAYLKGKFLVGICRGAQLINCVPNGGKLWQDVDGHESTVHKTFDCVSGRWIKTNSVHHQQMIITPKAEILAWAHESIVKKSHNDVWHRPAGYMNINPPEKEKDIEACYYPDTRSLLVQFHPEFGHPETTKYFFKLMDRCFWDANYNKIKNSGDKQCG